MTIARVISSSSFAFLCGVCFAVWGVLPAAACPTGFAEFYNSRYAMWCADEKINWSANEATVAPFFTYYDGVVATLSSLFPTVKMPQPIVKLLSFDKGFSSSKSGVTLGVNAFSGNFTNPATQQVVPGFWGYIALLHETINFMTAQVSPGWPEDWWTDEHFNPPFPNAMDIAVLRYMGTASNNQTLLNVFAAQQWRFYNPQSGNYDPIVIMLDNFQNKYGFEGFAQMFQLVQADQLSWPQVSQDPNYTGDNNWSALLSEYVIAYLSLGFGTTTDLTQTFVEAGVGTHSGYGVQPYTVDPYAVKAIGDAHCLIKSAKSANVNVSAQLTALQRGNFSQADVTGGTSATCPNECTWLQQWDQGPSPARLVFQRCVAKWDNCPDGVWSFQKQACEPWPMPNGSGASNCDTKGGTCDQPPPRKQPQ